MRPVHWILLGIAGLIAFRVVGMGAATVRQVASLPPAPPGPLPRGISSEAGFKQGVLVALRAQAPVVSVPGIFRQVAAAQVAYRPYYDFWASYALFNNGVTPALINLSRQQAGL